MEDRNETWADEGIEFLALSFGLLFSLVAILAVVLWMALL